MYNFYLPNFYESNFQNLNSFFIELLKLHPEYCYDNICISALYGTFPGVLWNGGRVITGEVYLKEAGSIIQKFNNIGIALRFTYSNSLIDETHLGDAYSNIITQLAHNGQNEILVNSPILENYLRQVYPHFKYLSSTTKCLLNKEQIIKEADKYYLTVLDYRHNKNFKLLNELNPKKYELLINPYCGNGCKNRKQHYEDMSKSQLENTSNNKTYENCYYYNDFFEAFNNCESFIKVEDLYEVYGKLGYKHFKIEGRCNSIIDVLESYLYYLIKPKYKDFIRHLALKNIFGKEKY